MNGLLMLELLNEIDPEGKASTSIQRSDDLIRLATKKLRAQRQQIEVLKAEIEDLKITIEAMADE